MVGIRGRETRRGTVAAERARITIGADGRNSRLARAVGAPVYDATPSLTCTYGSYWTDVACDALEIYQRDRRAIIAHPTNDGLTLVAVGWPVSEFRDVRSDIDGRFAEVVAMFPDFAERLHCGRRVEPYFGTADLPNFRRKPFGPGWALVGDAGYHKDPAVGLGVSDAFHDAELLTGAVDDAFSGKRPIAVALGDYERRRDEASAEDYRAATAAAQFTPLPEEAIQLRAALRSSPADATLLMMAREGMIAPEQFFNPENMQRIMSEAAMAASRPQVA